MQNTYKHISDSSSFVTFNPAGTQWDQSIKDVQTALSKIGSWAMIGKGLPISTETLNGIIRTATRDEVLKGQGSGAVTPKYLEERLAHPQATEAVLGLTKYATNAETFTGTINSKAVVPTGLKHTLDTRTSTEARTGLIKISSLSAAAQGVDDTTAMTPKKVKHAINQLSPSYGIATEKNSGTVNIASLGQVAQGQAHDGIAISPKGFVSTRASESQIGTTKIATVAQTKALSDATLVVSPKNLGQLKASESEFGLVKTTTTIGNTGANLALSPMAPVVPTSRTVNNKPLTGNIVLSSDDIGSYSKSQVWTKTESDERYMPKTDIPNQSFYTYFDAWDLGGKYPIGRGGYWADIGQTRLPFGEYTRLQFNLTLKNTSDLRPFILRIWQNDKLIKEHSRFIGYPNNYDFTDRLLINGKFKAGDIIRAEATANGGPNYRYNLSTWYLLFT
ncbi:short tail fibers protein [Proteus phage SJ_PmiM]|nr:short tail fibers protein [Proteus phage SJ_PmiM]